ncbi:four helix bundle protein [Candidatus Leptofilum sp.]|uniref:four helix bundle protein n=1 Tax=Candidatus Leptofilum sp. TaxID=3241576 RepID=UPI003B5AFA19
MDKQQFQKRTKQLGVRIIKMTEALPNTRAADVVARQIIRSSTSVGSNYRAACRAKSTADMINKLKIVEEEADETLFWLEMLIETELMTQQKLQALHKETDEILAMTIASIKTLRKRKS